MFGPSSSVGARSVLAFGLLMFILSSASAQRGNITPDAGDPGTGGNNSIVGNVYFPSGQRVDRPIRVRLFTSTRGDTTTMTSDNGAFSFRRLATGSYTVVIDAEKEYEPVSQGVYIIAGARNGPPQMIPVGIRLRLRLNPEAKPTVIDSRLAKVPAPALDAYNKALELGKHGNTKAAIEQLKKAVAASPEFMLAFNELGVQYLKSGDFDKADEALRSALKIAPDAFEPLMNHGILLVRAKRFTEAEPELRAALKQKDQSPVGHYYLGRALAYSGAFDEARKELTAAIDMGGDDMKEAHRYLAGVYNALGDKQRAAAELETYLRLAPKSPDAPQIRELIRKLKG